MGANLKILFRACNFIMHKITGNLIKHDGEIKLIDVKV